MVCAIFIRRVQPILREREVNDKSAVWRVAAYLVFEPELPVKKLRLVLQQFEGSRRNAGQLLVQFR